MRARRFAIAAFALLPCTFAAGQNSGGCNASAGPNEPVCVISNSPAPPTTANNQAGGTNVVSMGPREFQDLFGSVDQAINQAGRSVSNFLTWLFGSNASSRPIPPPDPEPHPRPPPGYTNPSQSFQTLPGNEAQREDFREQVLDGNDGPFEERADDPYVNTDPKYGDPPSGVDPHKPGPRATGVGPGANVADPVDVGSGAFLLAQADLSFPGPAWPLEFRRRYHSASTLRSALGSNWTHNFDVFVRPVTQFNAPPDYPPHLPFKEGVMLHDGGSGAAQLFLQVETGIYLALHGTSDTLEKAESGWLLRKPDGSTQRFDANGYLVEARDRFDNGYRVEYEPTPLYSLYQLHCAQGRPLRGEKACAMLDYAFGKSHPRRFVHDGTYAHRETRMYEEWVVGASAARAMARSDILDGGAEDDLVRRLRLRVGRDLLVRVRPQVQNDLDLFTQRDFDAETRVVKAVLVDVANAIVDQRDLYAQRGLAPAQLGRATRPIFDALRSDGIFTNNAGALKTVLSTAELRRIANFNLGLVSEVLYPDIFRTWHEYPNHPTIAAAIHADNAPLPAVGATEESTRIARRTWYNTAYRLLRLYLESPVEPTQRTRHATDGGHTHRPVRVVDDFGRELGFEYYESELGTGREAGLLKAVVGPAGTRVQFAYHRPSWYPHYLNEMFLVRVDRADLPVVPLPTFEGLVPSPPRGYRFEYAWERPDAEKVLFEWAWVVWRGPTNAGSRSAALAAGHYVSTIADNIVRVRRVAGTTTVVESETAFIFHPLHHAFDRVAAQRHGGSETQAAGSDYLLDGQRLITWATGLPQTIFSWAHPNYRRTWDFLPAPIRTQYRAEAVPHRIPPDYNFEYFTGPAEESGTPAILRTYNSCEQIRGASTSYVGLDIHYDASRQRYSMDYQDRSHPGVLTKVALDATRQRARLDGRRACTWVRVVDREGVATFYAVNFRGNVLVRAIEEQPAPRLLYAIEEALYTEDGQPREMRRPTLNQRWEPRDGGHRLSYQGAATLQGPVWRGRSNLVRVVETPRGSSKVHNWSVDGQARDVVARFATYSFEPVYNQVLRIRRGTIDEQQNERAHTQLDYVFCPDGNPDPPANAGNGNACAQVAPVTLRSGPPPPSPLRRTTQFEWTPAGKPAVIAAQDGARVEYAYYAALGLPPIPLPGLPPPPVLPIPGIGPPAPPPSSGPSHPEREASRENRGFLARVTWSRFDREYPAALGPPGGFCSALRGPYQWLLPSTCANPRDELRALGLPNVAVNAILAASQPGHPSQAYTQEFRYALTGNPIESTAGGSTTSTVIDTDGRPQSRTGPGDRRVYTYYDDGTLRTITRRDELGNIVGSEFRDYDRDGRVVVHSTGIQPLQGSATRFTYGPEGRLAERTTALDLVETFSYDRLGRLVEVAGRHKTATQPSRRTRFHYTRDGDLQDERHGTEATRAALGPVDRHLDYDGFGRQVAERDVHGREFRYSYDERDLVTKIAQAYTVRAEIDAAKQLGKDSVATVLLAYDADGRLLWRSRDGVVTERHAYSDSGVPLRSGADGLADRWSTYDRLGNVVWSRDAAGSMSVVTNDADFSVRTFSRMRADGTRVLTTTIEDRYDERSLVSTRVAHAHTGETRVERWHYDAAGHVRRYVDASGAATEFQRNFLGQPRLVLAARPQNATGNADIWTDTRFNDLAQPSELIDAMGQSTTFDYNEYGQVRSQRDPGSAFGASTIFSYDGYGRLREVRDPSGERRRLVYNARGYPAEERLPGASGPGVLLLKRAFDERGRIVEATDENPHLAALGIVPQAIRSRFAYDDAGRPREEGQRVRGSELVIRFSTELAGDRWRRRVVYPTHAAWTHTFDALGRLATMERQGSGAPASIQFDWLDDLYAGRTQHWRDGADPVVEATAFDGFGARTLWEYRAVALGADGAPTNPQWAAEYYGAAPSSGPHASLARWEAIRDVRARLGSVVAGYGHPNVAVAAGSREPFPGAHGRWWQGYGYDAPGRVTRAWAATLSGTEPAFPPQNFADPGRIDQLGSDLAASADEFTYEGYNGVAAITRGGAALWTADPRLPGSRLQSVNTAGAALAIVHNARGEITNDGRRVLVYDSGGRLVGVRSPTGTLREAYAYDGVGRLALIFRGGERIRLVWDGNRIVAAFDGNDRPMWEAAWGPLPSQLLEWRPGAGERLYIPLADPRNSIAAVWSSADRALTGLTAYDAAGQVTHLDGTESIACEEPARDVVCETGYGVRRMPFAFTSAFRSDATGAYYLGARWYSPRLGQFLSRDPAGLVDAVNPYAYAAHDPVNRWDRTGLASEGFVDTAIGAAKWTSGLISRQFDRTFKDPFSMIYVANPTSGMLAWLIHGNLSPTALQQSPDPGFLANFNPALGVGASGDASASAGLSFEGGGHAADAVNSLADLWGIARGGASLVRGVVSFSPGALRSVGPVPAPIEHRPPFSREAMEAALRANPIAARLAAEMAERGVTIRVSPNASPLTAKGNPLLGEARYAENEIRIFGHGRSPEQVVGTFVHEAQHFRDYFRLAAQSGSGAAVVRMEMSLFHTEYRAFLIEARATSGAALSTARLTAIREWIESAYDARSIGRFHFPSATNAPTGPIPPPPPPPPGLP